MYFSITLHVNKVHYQCFDLGIVLPVYNTQYIIYCGTYLILIGLIYIVQLDCWFTMHYQSPLMYFSITLHVNKVQQYYLDLGIVLPIFITQYIIYCGTCLILIGSICIDQLYCWFTLHYQSPLMYFSITLHVKQAHYSCFDLGIMLPVYNTKYIIYGGTYLMFIGLICLDQLDCWVPMHYQSLLMSHHMSNKHNSTILMSE